MIASFVLYSLVIGAIVAAAAWLLEIAVARYGRGRRPIWLAAIACALSLPPIATLVREPAPKPNYPLLMQPAPAGAAVIERTPADPASEPRESPLATIPLDSAVAVAWTLASAAFVAFHLIGAWRLRRRARHWRPSAIDTQAIAVSADVGPALYGWWNPRVVFPAWLLAAPLSTQRLALAHERQHLDARDPQVLAAATLLVALLPWNLPLLWMLRRFRFAMEVDCDARVLRAGADPTDYGLALLFVSQRQARPLVATLALIERASQLERRIRIMVDTPRHRAIVAGLCVALAGACALAAAQIEAPARVAETPLKPVPSGGPGLRVGQSIERLLAAEYPELLEGKFEGTPVIVTLMNEEFSIVKSGTRTSAEPEDKFDNEIFGVIGIPPEEVPYVGVTGIQLPDQPQKRIYAVYTEKPGKPGERFVSHLFPDSRQVDRQIFERYFDAGIRNAMPAGSTPWVLLDRNGAVLRSGQEPIGEGDFRKVLESRFAGVRAQEVTNTPLVDVNGNSLLNIAGKELNLVSVWLAPESPPPKN